MACSVTALISMFWRTKQTRLGTKVELGGGSYLQAGVSMAEDTAAKEATATTVVAFIY